MMFKEKKINYSDLQVLGQLVAGPKSALFIFDPNNKVNWDTAETNIPESCQAKILINFGGDIIRFKEYELNDFDFIIDFSKTISINKIKTTNYKVVQAPNGSLRYVFQKKETTHAFLSFLATPSFRAKLIKRILRLTLLLGLSKFVTKSFNIINQKKLYFRDQLQINKTDFVNLFLGTPGFCRKPVAQIVTNKTISAYIKLPISDISNDLIKKEKANILRVDALNLTQLILPEIEKNKFPEQAIQPLQIRALEEKNQKRTNAFTVKHFNACKNLMLKSLKSEQLKATDFYNDITENLYLLNNINDPRLQKLVHQLELLKQKLTQHKTLITATTHGDFTPWNVILQKEKPLYVFDWEMTIFGAPLFYDIFHFLYHTETLVKRNNSNKIDGAIAQVFQNKAVKEITDQFKISIQTNYEFYLLHSISKNLLFLTKQKNYTADQNALVRNWESSLSNIDLQHNDSTCREKFLTDLQEELSSVNYAALKFNLSHFSKLPLKSDLDLIIKRNEMAPVIQYIEKYKTVKKTILIQKSFMTVCQIHFTNNAYLSIDFIHDFIRKGKRYLNSNNLLLNTTVTNGIKLPSLFDDITYTQHFYTLNKSSIPLQYQQLFASQLLKSTNATTSQNTYLQYYKDNYTSNVRNLTDTFAYSKEKYSAVKKHVKLRYGFSPYNKLKKIVNYLKDLLIDLKLNKGFLVTFSGVDGTGKTTIIALVKAEFELKYRKEVVLLRHRPGILPILSALKHGGRKKAEFHASTQLPRQGKNKNKISSLMRFAYYYTDYLIGQTVIYFKYVLRGKVVLYDRYYYDFINDAKRSNITLKPSIIKRLFALIHKPKFNFYLYNTAAVILSRKQELSALDINVLNSRYLALFTELKNKHRGVYCPIKNDDKAITVTTIFNTINKSA